MPGVCWHCDTDVLLVVVSVQLHSQSWVAVAFKAITPELAVPPVPTLILKAILPLLVVTDGVVPNPEEIVGTAFVIHMAVSVNVVNFPVFGVVPPIAPGAAKVAPLSDDALRFGTLVVLVTMNGAVPVATED